MDGKENCKWGQLAETSHSAETLLKWSVQPRVSFFLLFNLQDIVTVANKIERKGPFTCICCAFCAALVETLEAFC